LASDGRTKPEDDASIRGKSVDFVRYLFRATPHPDYATKQPDNRFVTLLAKALGGAIKRESSF
jgi:hypothetical protein